MTEKDELVWKILTKDGEPHAVTVEPSGLVTAWSYTVWGPIGQSGFPGKECTVRNPINRKERGLIDHAKALVEKAMRSQGALVTAMQATRKRGWSMIYTRFRYSGDPAETCVQMTRAEFLEAHPRRNTQVIDADTGEVLEEIKVPKDLILCDLCNAEIGEQVWLIPGYALCEACYRKVVVPHILPYLTRASVAR
jgi:hypothetical protein